MAFVSAPLSLSLSPSIFHLSGFFVNLSSPTSRETWKAFLLGPVSLSGFGPMRITYPSPPPLVQPPVPPPTFPFPIPSALSSRLKRPGSAGCSACCCREAAMISIRCEKRTGGERRSYRNNRVNGDTTWRRLGSCDSSPPSQQITSRLHLCLELHAN